MPFCPAPELRGENGLSEEELREKCMEALRRLEEMGPEFQIP